MITDQVKEITQMIYDQYGTDSGILFGIPANQRTSVEGVVRAALDNFRKVTSNTLQDSQKPVVERALCLQAGWLDLNAEDVVSMLIEVANPEELRAVLIKDIEVMKGELESSEEELQTIQGAIDVLSKNHS